MKLSKLTLKHFRNYADLSLPCSPQLNILLGKNGQGKTNLLEAVYFLSHTKSNRTGSDRELLQHGQPQALLMAEILPAHFEGLLTLTAQLSLADETSRLKTSFKINGTPARSRSAVLGYIPSVGFFLSDLLLLRGTPENRRQWLDAATTQYDKRHLAYASEYHRIRQQKSRLLKNDPQTISAAHLDTWNDQLARAGAQLMASRMQYISMAEHPAMARYAELSATQETLSLAYKSDSVTDTDGPIDVPQLTALLQTQLIQRQPEEIRRGTCLVGPHRDDVVFCLNDRDAATYGSQGQQRSIVLALKLTELSLLQTRLGEAPVLLLDDVMAELDPDRQAYLMANLPPEAQVFLTTTHLDHTLAPLLTRTDTDIRIMEISAGEISDRKILSEASV